MSIVFKITPELESICAIVDSTIDRFFKAQSKLPFNTYEHEVTANINLLNSTRLLKSIVELARIDLVYIPSALVIARSIFENLTRTTWILLPNDKFLNEARYVAYLETEIEYLQKISKGFGTVNPLNENFLNSSRSVLQFKNDLRQLLIDKGYTIPMLPNVREMLKQLNEERKYLYYVMLSQYSHVSHHSSTIYQKHLGNKKELSESPNVDLWKFSFGTTVPIFRLAAELYLASLGNVDDIFPEIEKDDFEKLIL